MDKKKIDNVISENSKRIFNYLLKILRHQEDAEDLLQEVFVAFYEKMSDIHPAAYQSYLYKTAYHKALNHIKKKKKKWIEPTADLSYLKSPSSENFVSDKIRYALQKLSVKDATIIELKYYQKKSYEEIAAIMSLSVRAVDSRLVRAKKKLRKIIVQDFPQNSV
jgi:RNA polymerase sigma-70 factor, ECF subfamily